MRRAQSLRKGVYALVVLSVFMIILRFCHLASPLSPLSADPEEAGAIVHHNVEVAHEAAVHADVKTENVAPVIEDTLSNDKADTVIAENSEAEKAEEKEKVEYDASKLFNQIVKGSSSPPVIIFSKSYCPHSMRAKKLLLEAYAIKPTPKVVELDLIDHGLDLQSYLKEVTGRATVPNILVNGISRGGASDMVELSDSLAMKFMEWGEGKLSIAKEQAAVQG